MIGGLELVKKKRLFLSEVRIGGFKLGELNDSKAVLDEAGLIGRKDFMSLVKGLLGFKKEKIVAKGNDEEKKENFREKRLHKGIIYRQLIGCRSKVNDVYLFKMKKKDKDKKKKIGEKKTGKLEVWLLAGLAALLVIVIGIAMFFYGRWQRYRDDPMKAQKEQIERETNKVVRKVSKLMILPEDEMPSLVTVSNKEEINENQEFFKLTEDGDKMLIYRQARKAILYRPKSNRIVNVAPVNVSSGGQTGP